jgi:hypothetical protein
VSRGLAGFLAHRLANRINHAGLDSKPVVDQLPHSLGVMLPAQPLQCAERGGWNTARQSVVASFANFSFGLYDYGLEVWRPSDALTTYEPSRGRGDIHPSSGGAGMRRGAMHRSAFRQSSPGASVSMRA